MYRHAVVLLLALMALDARAADTAIGALSAASSAAAANEYPINEAGTTKKVTGTQIKTFVNDAPTFAAGSASAGTKPKLTSGALLTAPEAGAFEMLDDTIYATSETGNRGVMVAEHWIRQASSRALTSTTAEQKLFNAVTNGALNLATGTYFFEGLASISGLSATSGNGAFDILGAGTAVLSDVLYLSVGVDGSTATAATQTGATVIQGQSPASMQTAGTGTTWNFSLRGTFEVTTAGTIIPSVSLVTAAAGTVAAGTYFKVHRVGAINAVSVGDWN